MRSLALLLLLLNISFLTWQLSLLPWQPRQPERLTLVDRPHPPSASDLPQLVLLSERNLLNNIPTMEKTVNLNRAENQTVTTPPPTDITMVAATANPLTETNPAADISDTETHEESTGVPLATPSKLQQAVGLMASEKKSVDSKKANNETAPHASTPPKVLSASKNWKPSLPKPPREQRSCFQAGPYTQISTAKKIVKWLKRKKDITANIQRRQTQVLGSTWVYLPPFKNRQAAISAQQRLNRLGIGHHEIIKKGPFNNAISLGLYRQPSSVKRRFKELSAKGYKNLKTQKRYKSDTKYWLNVKMPHQNVLLNAFRKKFLRHELEKVACK
jgi:phage terminase small subunit